jgi:argininosuccinate lyase
MFGKCNRIQALPNDLALITTNLPSGYHRDLQLLKETLFPAFTDLKDCLHMATFMLENITVKEAILEDERYKYLFSVEETNRLVLSGVPFREAYQQIGAAIENASFSPQKTVNHTHEGSIGNLCNEEITECMNDVLLQFPFEKVNLAIQNLLK